MKISLSNIQMGIQAQNGIATARVQGTQVTQLENNEITNRRQASINQFQQLNYLDTIQSHTQSQITDNHGNVTTLEHVQTLQDAVQLISSQDITITRVANLSGNPQAITNLEINRVFAIESHSNIQVETLGKVITEDGREIDFMMELNIERRIEGQQISRFTGERNLVDPLVINLNGHSAQLSDGYFEFDLNNDGQTEQLHRTAAGTGFIAFDKNQNGIIDNGSELFGPNTGNGFSELAQYDEDHNGWIDENDSIFYQLSFMDFDDDGNQRLQSIEQVGLGAFSLSALDMSYDLYDSDGNFQGELARTGMALKENGQALYLQELYYPDQSNLPSETLRIDSIDVNGNQVFISNASALTQFQFDNPLINARIADTSVRVSSNQLNINQSQLEVRELELRVQNEAISHQFNVNSAIQSATDRLNKEQSSASLSANELRAKKQAHFQNLIKENAAEIVNIQNSQGKENTQRRIEVADLSQSVFWEYNNISVIQQANEDEQVVQLRQLIESLKSMREQQVKQMEKLRIYRDL